jgi:hypothetical protein
MYHEPFNRNMKASADSGSEMTVGMSALALRGAAGVSMIPVAQSSSVSGTT